MATAVDGQAGDIPSSPELQSSSFEHSAHDESPSQPPLPARTQPSPEQNAEQQQQLREQLEKVTLSDIGLDTLLKRLKQSVSSTKDFAAFLKKRSIIEEEHATGLKKLSRSVHDGIRRPEHRQGSYAQAYDEVTRFQDRMADNGIQFSVSLHQMSDDLQELAANIERGRKHWKQTGTAAEKRVLDAENAMEKAKSKYDSLADQYDRARTGDRQSGRFGLKGPKSAAQQEEDLNRKLQAADSDYQTRVQAAQSQRQELISTLRPQASKALQDLIAEADSGLVLQMQKFATFNEKLLLGNGLVISPLKNQANGATPQSRSLRDVIQSVDNTNDFNHFILSHTNQARPRIGEIRYEQHPTLRSSKQPPSQAPPAQSFASLPMSQQHPLPHQNPIQQQSPMSQQNQMQQQNPMQQHPMPEQPQPPFMSEHRPSSSGYGPGPNHGPGSNHGPPQIGQLSGITSSQAPPPLSGGFQGPPPGSPYAQQRDQYSQPSPGFAQPPHGSPKLAPISSFEPLSISGALPSNGPSNPNTPRHSNANGHLPPINPVFGVSLEELFQRDQSAVPMIVYQCLQAVDLFGLDIEGLYRVSGSNPHIMDLKQQFDHDASTVDFRDPTSFHHDISSVAGLVKLFFRSLPDPLLTNLHYSEFISAAQIPDDILRRDSLHAIINALPDPNYATLRVLMLHLNRVQEHSDVNRMTAQNLAIVWGPTLMQGDGPGGRAGGGPGPDIRDAGWQAKVVETILVNTLQIFDDDE